MIALNHLTDSHHYHNMGMQVENIPVREDIKL